MYQAVDNLQVSRKLLLTGSPLQNHLTEYGSMIKLINPHVFDDAVFKKEFADVIDRGMRADASSSACKIASSSAAIACPSTAAM